jgi:hypothetical protein
MNAIRSSQLHRRDFLRVSAATLLAGTLASCSQSLSLTLRQGAGDSNLRRVRTHKTYQEFVASLKLEKISPDVILEPHFHTARGVRNSLPPKSLWANMEPTLRVADELAKRLGAPLVRINSAYRSPRYNARIGGAASGSQHLNNNALDLKFACGASEVAHLARRLRDEGSFAGGIGIYRKFVHLDTRGENVTWWG